MTSSQLAYVQARLQYRHGQRPDQEGWRALEASADLGSYLESARSTSLRPWVQHLSADARIHDVERTLRQDWRLYVASVARWVPVPWQDAVEWTGTLPDLPHLTHLARGEPAWPWMLEDPVLAPLAHMESSARSEALQASPFAGLAAAIASGALPIKAWLEQWAIRWPGEGGQHREALQQIGREFRLHTEEILAQPLGQTTGPPLRERLMSRLHRTFRARAGEMEAVFAHLGLMLLDMERLRGGLVLRVLFPDPMERPRWS